MPSSINREMLQSCLEQCFGQIPDPRVERTRAHQLLDIITIALFAVLSGADGWVAIETYGNAKRTWLETFLALPNGIPSHDIFARVFARLDPKALEASFQQWIRALVSTLEAELIAIDGKTAKGSYDREGGSKALQLVSAWASEHRLVLGQCSVDSKSNEITAIPVLLEQLALAGCIVSIDATGTQSAIAEQITTGDADYILALKGNHPTLLAQAQAGFETAQARQWEDVEHTQHQETETGHHRIESRTIWQIPATQVFSKDQLEQWAGLQRLVVVHSQRRLWNKDTVETRYFLSSLSTDAQTFARYIRAHWGVENQLHWCLDVVFNEDASRIRKDHAPQNMSVLRRLALNLLRQEPSKGSLAMKRYRAGLDDQFMLQILSASMPQSEAHS
ncbi:ISAs1 family transposase [Leptodesmis sichuanensis]|uniref:ISAs1 family transposase n=1 Tax=Leptodesmis sichuanensis TaxID=2906798 RepID=UPI001F2F6375|nr:ISAs1 family transposase [Leptodesmis sichuanensis]UIE38761.1 ISAs1 family transposase [Leptodesmis sichuanensis A121]